MNNRLLIIDDDEDLCELISEYLTAEGFAMTAIHEGADGAEKALTGEFDLIILDVMLPQIDGFEALRRIRQKSKVPVMMLTARGDDTEKIVGLESGADDYLPKPFNPLELAARIRAILRRVSDGETTDAASSDKLKIDDVEISETARSARRGGEDLQLTSVEFDLLVALLRQAGKIIKKEDLSRTVLERSLSPYDRSLDMHISNLRKKLGKRDGGDNEERIKTIRSVGYIYTIN